MLSNFSSIAFPGCFDGVTPLLAYLDPGSGSMILQLVIAGLLSSMFFVKSTLMQFKGWMLGGRAAR